eukprot:TRINITY_DN2690_c0_g1_i1.p1 TRINITY_DN2690_c0_g1~~TRINITY_DN2690_c0_g1_i1.p1  ORF type:complete len:172 (-),score=56.11 TRINITY_DN2690_c0_g1_i1:113-568(-)
MCIRDRYQRRVHGESLLNQKQMVLWRLVNRLSKGRHLQAPIDQTKFASLPFDHSWENLVKMYDLRMWYIQNSPHDERCVKYVHDLERLHNELNYLNMRDYMKRFVLATILFYGFYALYTFPSFDWHDNHELKHEIHLYTELDEGSDEGDED